MSGTWQTDDPPPAPRRRAQLLEAWHLRRFISLPRGWKDQEKRRFGGSHPRYGGSVSSRVNMSPKVHLCRAQIYLHCCERRAPPPTSTFHTDAPRCAKIDGACEWRTSAPPLPQGRRRRRRRLCHMIKEAVGRGGKAESGRKKQSALQAIVGVNAKRNPIFINVNLVRNKWNESSFLSDFLFFDRNTTRTIKPPGTASLTISVSPLEVIMQRQASVSHQEWIIPR